MDSEPELLVPALHVEYSGSDEEFDLNIPPSSGNEYLRRVRLEAQQCPDVVVAKIDLAKIKQSNKQNSMFNGDKGCQPAPQGYAPSIEWQRQQVADFSKLRLTLNTRKKNVKMNVSIKLPNMDDDVGWCKLCFGNSVSSNSDKSSEDDSDGLLPLVSVVVHMSQPLIEQVLDYHLAWFETTGFTPAQGRWFFALLACLEKPLTPDACSSLRTLVRYCANLRAAIDNDDARLPHLNLLICLVTRYFDQSDLADE